jgi:hypothetical protein
MAGQQGWEAWAGYLRLLGEAAGAGEGEQCCSLCLQRFEPVHTAKIWSFLGLCTRHEGSDMSVCYRCAVESRRRLSGWRCCFCRDLRPVVRSLLALRALVARAREVMEQGIRAERRERLRDVAVLHGELRSAVFDDAGERARTRYVRFEVLAEVQGLWGEPWRGDARGDTRGGQLLFATWMQSALLPAEEVQAFHDYLDGRAQRLQPWVQREGVWVAYEWVGSEEDMLEFKQSGAGGLCVRRSWLDGGGLYVSFRPSDVVSPAAVVAR